MALYRVNAFLVEVAVSLCAGLVMEGEIYGLIAEYAEALAQYLCSVDSSISVQRIYNPPQTKISDAKKNCIAGFVFLLIILLQL